ncbi:GNAT family N-acetyltransferase [Flavobacterium sp.]|uniref:GNAT family N-acetyltransferase n=1 Tax=Flavobacterium sp. TaxID=239 RepID=UPI0038FBEA5B
MEIIHTKDQDLLNKWDTFVTKEDKGSHLLFSDWVKSYQSYGFDYEFCIGLENDCIVGGYAAIIPKALFFNFFIIPFGPIVAQGFENRLNELIETVPQRAKYHNSCYCHITLPFSTAVNNHVYPILPKLVALNKAKTGHLFKYIYASNGLNWISLKGFLDAESKIMSLSSSVRRNIRNSYRKGLFLEDMNTIDKLENGHRLFEETAKQGNYSIRAWDDIKESLLALLDKGSLKMLGAYKNGELKGAILLIQAGNYFTYILGGSKKEVPDLRTGDFLQWEAIKLSIENGFDGYNISLGGSKGVMDFKNSFNTVRIPFEQSKYYWVLKPFYFRVFIFFEKCVRPFKNQVSKILSILKNKK